MKSRGEEVLSRMQLRWEIGAVTRRAFARRAANAIVARRLNPLARRNRRRIKS